MPTSIGAVADAAPWRLQPVESIADQRRSPGDVVASVRRFVPGSVAPALFEALASEPWGHPMPQKSVWEQAATPPAPAASSPAAPVATAWLTSLLKAR